MIVHGFNNRLVSATATNSMGVWRLRNPWRAGGARRFRPGKECPRGLVVDGQCSSEPAARPDAGATSACVFGARGVGRDAPPHNAESGLELSSLAV